ncbi:hypothetical protein SAMN02745823_03204 [Sporobacter termitidis DSM 10068]|uniref:Zn-finger containing protein n=1 Tax=Sporobacter termitidis DSM 10068 TaxID=1123282 RepID=A0A1M5Z446_9FIRM|nr:hypothetical protein [Sporobacter termitidis]SHI19056.1 hypothetical protein SAMN02745823_03204 [Sporobacter termitidis DSM 10068]
MNFLRNFMAGRYGPDQLNGALIIAALILSILSRFAVLWVLIYLSYVLLILAVFRMLSRNVQKRRAENDKFLRFWWPVRQKFKAYFSSLKSRKTHKFFKCPSCSNLLRVPRGKGKMQITCPKCGERFVRKT